MGDREKSCTSSSPRCGLSAVVTFLLLMMAAAPGEAQDRGDGQVTFTKDVAPILYQKCASCHRPSSIAPMSLLTYELARPYALLIKEMVSSRTMPPWFVDKTVGIQSFKDDRSLSDEEIATIVRWADSDAPQGDPAAIPPLPEFEDIIYQWTLEDEMGRPPDHIVAMPEAFTIPGNSGNLYPRHLSDPGLEEDRWIMAYETKPSLDGFSVVHHNGTTFIYPDGREEEFGEYALGKTGDIFPEGTGRFIPAGTKIRWSSHYSGSRDGEDHTDLSRLALWFYPEGVEPEHRINRDRWGAISDLDIPPNTESVRSDGYTVLDQNVRLTAYQPHMHYLGDRQCLEVIYPDSRRQTLNCVGWDFGWHMTYNYVDDEQPLIPKGSVIHLTHWHNNSGSNPWAGDPENWVGYGGRSTDDMAFAHMSNYYLSDEEFERDVQERLMLLQEKKEMVEEGGSGG
jgi:mono/diheme cytochrome c family protein